MAGFFSVNNSIVSGTAIQVIWQLIVQMQAAGWTQAMSSDGGTYGTGTHVTSDDSSAAGGFGRQGAWVVLQQPTGGSGVVAGTRQVLIWRSNASAGSFYDSSYYVSYSKGGLFNISTATAQMAPTATDEKVIMGSGSHSSPSFYQLFQYTGMTGFYFDAAAWDAVDPNYPLCFYVMFRQNGTGNNEGFFYLDFTSNGSSADTDPCIFGMVQRNTQAAYSTISQSTPGATAQFNSATWWNPGNASGGVAPVFSQVLPGVIQMMSIIASPTSIGTDPCTGQDSLLPILWGNPTGGSGQAGYKGVSRLFKWKCTSRSTGDTCSVASSTSKEYIVFGDLVLPWNGSSPLV